MQQVYSKSHNKISLDTLSFEVISYKIEHIKTISSYFTMSNSTGMYTNGVKPYILTLKGYFPKTDGNSIATSLESVLVNNQSISFTLNNISFTDVTLNKYSFKEEVSSMYQECEISFMGLGSFSVASTQEATFNE